MTEILSNNTMKKKDFVSDQEVKWCAGCGSFSVLNAVQSILPDITKRIEDVIFVSGIGCSSRFPYYMNTYGIHGIHGRAAPIATGVKLANPNLDVWIVSGDGDSMAIGGNHFIHLIRRNINVNLILLNNKIYGLTKGQLSPTTPIGSFTKTSPDGSIEHPFRPGLLTIGARGTFFARLVDTDLKLLKESIIKGAKHKGTSVMEILQNCVIYNNDVHSIITAKENKADNQLQLHHGEPMLFGKEKEKGIIINKETFKLEKVVIGENGITIDDILVHNEKEEDSWLQLKLIHLHPPQMPLALGVIRCVESPTYSQMFEDQMEENLKNPKYKNMDELLNSGDIFELK